MGGETAQLRAELSGKLTTVLDSRSLAYSQRRLAALLAKGMTVLDVGCGTGAITRGIAEAVGPNGRVVGIDNNPRLIERARQAHRGIPGLSFEQGDIYTLSYENAFDVVTSARVFIWLSDPLKALKGMIAAAAIGGRIVVTDYNHEKIVWEPQPPASMLSFYSAYLKWRSDAGMDNEVADHLPDMFQKCGLQEIVITPQHEITKRTDPDFPTRIGIWADTASSRGFQMERDGYSSEKEYVTAETEYREWMGKEAQSLTMYMLAVEGVK